MLRTPDTVLIIMLHCVCPLKVLPGPEQSGPKAAGLWRGAAFPEPFDRQQVPTRHQREPVSPTQRPLSSNLDWLQQSGAMLFVSGPFDHTLPEHG